VKRSHKIKILRESHPTPDWAAELLRNIGGLNRFGEANFRLIWGWNRLEWIGGKFEDRDEEGVLIREVLAMRREPRYAAVNRWLIEQWLPPKCSPEAWYKQTQEWGEEGNIPQLGPYPSRGEYELLSVLETEQQEFVQVERWLLEGAVWALRRAKKVSYQEGVRRRKEIAKKKRRDDAAYAHQYLNEATRPAFNEKMFVNVL
jgi:hypothetical protein